MRDLNSGFLPGKHVYEILSRIRDSLSGREVVVIRSIDSAVSQQDLGCALSFHNITYNVTNGNVWVSAEELSKALDEHLFAGFDEIWLYSGDPPQMDLTAVPLSTSDGTDFSHGVPTELVNAINKTHAMLVLGDGCGLNYVSDDYRFERILNGS